MNETLHPAGTPELEAEFLAERTLGALGPISVARLSAGCAAQLGLEGTPVVGLKLVAPDSEHSEEAVKLLREDAQVLKNLRHPNLLRVFGLLRRGREEFAAVELPDGDDLAAIVSRKELPLQHAAGIAREIALALGTLAATRPHRDFRLSCVFVSARATQPKGTPAFDVRILPLAFPPEFRVESRASKSSIYRGLPQYAAPELHADGGANPTEKSNIFAFGVAFFEMLTCQPPFRGSTPTRMLLDVRESEPPRPSALVRDVPLELERICLRCLEKDPEHRFPNFAALEASLRIASETSPLVRRPPSTRSIPVAAPPSQPSHLRMTRRQVAVAAALSCVAVLALLLAFLPRLTSLRDAAPAGELAEKVLKEASALLKAGDPEKALRLLEAHSSVRMVSPATYDDLRRQAALAHWLSRASKAEESARWSEAAQAVEEAAGLETPERREKLLLKREQYRFRAHLAKAEEAELALDWKLAREQLQAASALAVRLSLGAEEIGTIERRTEFARLAALAAEANAAGNETSERSYLLRAALLGLEVPETGSFRSARAAVLKRLQELGSGPGPAEELISRAKAALASGDVQGALHLTSAAAEAWPLLSEAKDLLAYIEDLKSCEAKGMVLVSNRPPGEGWLHHGRPQAFCIQRYEFPGVEGQTPHTLVSAVEAAALCAQMGGRLCRLAEWQLACSGRESLTYPYGNKYRADACATERTSVSPSGAYRDCRSPFGVMDMSGNVAEWTAESVGVHTLVAGGDWSSGAELSRCSSVTPFNPGLTSTRVGFRCCSSIGSSKPER